MNTNTKRKITTLIAFSCTLGVAVIGSASAATISTTTIVNESSIINTGGTLVSAANFGGAAVTVNGIVHGAGRASGVNLTENINFEGFFRDAQTGFGGNLETLLEGIGGVSSANPIVMSISGLTVGDSYLFQTYFEHNADTSIALTFESDTINSVADQPNGIVISYEFEALDDTLNISIVRDESPSIPPSGNVWVSGYSIQTQAIPEPSSTALLGLGVLALILRRRK